VFGVILGGLAVADGMPGEFDGMGTDVVADAVAAVEGRGDRVEELGCSQLDVLEVRTQLASGEELAYLAGGTTQQQHVVMAMRIFGPAAHEVLTRTCEGRVDRRE